MGSERCAINRARHYTEHKDVRHFLCNYVADKLFEYVPGRHHAGFTDIVHEWKVNDSRQLVSKLSARSRKLDIWRTFAT